MHWLFNYLIGNYLACGLSPAGTWAPHAHFPGRALEGWKWDTDKKEIKNKEEKYLKKWKGLNS